MKRAFDNKDGEVIDLTNESEDSPVNAKKVKISRETSQKPSTSKSSKVQNKPQKINSRPLSESKKQSGSFSKNQNVRNSREQQWIKMGWNPNNRQRQSGSSGPPLMSMNFPSPDVFSHPSQQYRRGPCPDPDKFLPVIDTLCSSVNDLIDSGPNMWPKLTQSILKHFNQNQQERRLLNRKIELWKELYKQLHTQMDCGLFVTGSTFNGFGSSGCDFDMCLFPDGHSVNDKQWLNITRQVLRKKCRHFIRGNIELINAKVPILKFDDKVGRLEVDLSVNNPTAARNTHLLYCYSQLDPRVRPLVMALKLWAKKNGINEARFQTLSSYTLSLMMIHFLQCGVSPPVLPCLQRTHAHVFHPNSDIYNLPYDVPPFQSDNQTDSVGKLFVEFFNYFTDRNR